MSDSFNFIVDKHETAILLDSLLKPDFLYTSVQTAICVCIIALAFKSFAVSSSLLCSIQCAATTVASRIFKLVSVIPDEEFGQDFEHKQAFSTWIKVLKLAKPEAIYMAGGLVAALLTTICNLYQPVLLGQCFDIASRRSYSSVEIQSNEMTMASIFTTMIFCEFIKGCSEYARERLNNNVGDFVRQRAQGLLFGHVLRFEMAYFDQTHTSEINKYFQYLDELHYLAGHLIPQIIRSSLTLLLSSIYMIFCNGFIGAIVMTLLISQGAIEKYLDEHVHEAWTRLERVEKKCNELREESLANVRTIKHFSCEGKQTNLFLAVLNEDRELRKRLVHLWASRCGMGSILLSTATTACWFFGLHEVLRGHTTVGNVSALVLLVNTVREAANGIFSAYQDTMKKTQRMASVFEVMERPSEKLADECAPTSNPIAIDGLIEIKDVRFHYPSRPDTEVLQSFSLTLRPGTVTALCGPSGGGKTSVARLLLRDYEPCSGAVLIDGVDVRSLDLGGYRARVAVVSQEPSLFSGTIEDNIKFGASRGGGDVPHVRVEAAARLANAHDFISALDAGYATAVGERGARLSGGQRQRIAIARALLMDPRILILDEATSALDAESEREVQEALDRAVRGRTTLVIAHRLSTVRAAHRIAVVERGRVSEEGTHEELAAAAGAYARLANAPPRVG